MPLKRKQPRISIVDSHTGGEPTRVVTGGAPDLGKGSIAKKMRLLKARYDWIRRATVLEPRGSDVWVGALLCPPTNEQCTTGVIFYNNVGYLNMCGHCAIGVVSTLAYLRRIRPGTHLLDTPVGIVSTVLHKDGSVSITGVPSFRKAKDVHLAIPGLGPIVGDVAWGGNWFYLVEASGSPLSMNRVPQLTEIAWQFRREINTHGFPEVDHIEMVGPPTLKRSHSRNFVLCPGGAYDRSPCGTGTSAKLACLAADGELNEGEVWLQESIVGSRFSAHYRWLDREQGLIEPTIRGNAYVNGESTLVFDPEDPFRFGLKAS